MHAGTRTLAAAALAAFAANALLCRLALQHGAIDPASFSALRIASGAIVLLALARLRGRALPLAAGWRGGAWLAAYAGPFAFAYVSLGAATGALLLFGAVQLTMFGLALRAGSRPTPLQWAGTATAASGLVLLLGPGLRRPDPLGAALMTAAGVAWGAYTWLGRGATDPVARTTVNFLWATPWALAASALGAARLHITPGGAGLAILSGGVASGLGYVAWYAALPRLRPTTAALTQLLVPVLTAVGAVALLGEPLTVRLLTATLLVCGGVALAVAARRSQA